MTELWYVQTLPIIQTKQTNEIYIWYIYVHSYKTEFRINIIHYTAKIFQENLKETMREILFKIKSITKKKRGKIMSFKYLHYNLLYFSNCYLNEIILYISIQLDYSNK